MRDIPGLGELLRSARERFKLSQEELGAIIGVSLGTVSQAETKTGKVNLETVLKAHSALCEKAGPEHLASWLVAWLADKVELAQAKQDATSGMAAQAVELLARREAGGHQQGTRVETLADIEPLRNDPNLVVIFADRKEPSFKPTPYARGDLPVAYSGAASDLMFLQNLGLRREVVMLSDKIVAATSAEFCAEHFGNRNLIVVGSPATNLVARLANGISPFRFNLSPDVANWEREFRKEKRFYDSRFQVMFWNVVQYMVDIADGGGPAKPSRAKRRPAGAQSFLNKGLLIREVLREDHAFSAFDTQDPGAKPLSADDLQILHQIIGGMVKLVPPTGTHKDLLSMLRGEGILDMADGAIHGTNTYDYNDFGLLALCPNPFTPKDSDHVCILAAGQHGPGTSHSLRLLSGLAEETCAERPFGGTFEITMKTERAWPDKFQGAVVSWQTDPYGGTKLQANLEQEILARDSAPEKRTNAFYRLTTDDLQQYVDFLRTRV